MTVVNGYTDVATLASFISVNDSDLDLELESAINAASRQIDAHCGRRFWQDSTVKVREYRADDRYILHVDDISTATGLIIKLDTDDDDVFETTVTINTDFVLAPYNAAEEVPVRPYTAIELVDNYTFPTNYRRPGVQVTAKFGWPAVPDAVKQACLIQAKNIYKASVGSIAGYQVAGDTGIVVRSPNLDFMAMSLLEDFRRGWVG